jgi:hypothetical protein
LAIAGKGSAGPRAAVPLVLLQLAGLYAWFREGWRIGRGWASANFITGAAWLVLFLGPCVIYAVAPRYLTGLNVIGAVAVVNLSLFGLLAGYMLSAPRGRSRAATRQIAIRSPQEKPGRAAACFAAGLLGLAVLFAHAGGPFAYLSRLDATAGLNSGLFYVVAIALALRFSPFAVVFLRWARGARVGPRGWAFVAAGLGLLMLTGARSFVAVGAVQLIFASLLLRGRPSLVRTLPVAVITTLVLVFGVGTIKRHQTYNVQHPRDRMSLIAYAEDVAPYTAVDAYANNYVDTVRLVAVARAVVPHLAPYEGARPIVELALKPIPSTIRPAITRNSAISRVFDPHGGYAYATPLQVTAYLAGGPIAVALVFVLVGFAVGRLDEWLAQPALRSPAAAAAAIALAVQVPVMLRSGVPNGIAFLGTEVLGTAVVTWLVAGGALPRRNNRRPPQL